MVLHLFTLGDIPVRVSLWYGILVLYWFQGTKDPRYTLLWALVVTLSILVHELGHALVARYYRLRPGILLHGLGGLCHHDRAERDRHDVLIIAAGPFAGLALGLLTWLVGTFAPTELAETTWFDPVVSMSLYVNVGWSLVNLLPIWPLDGGQLFRLGVQRLASPARADTITHYTALTLLAIAAIVVSKYMGQMFIVLILWTAWSNVSALLGQTSAGPARVTRKDAGRLLAELRDAYDQADFKEAARLGYLLKSVDNAAPKTAREGMRLLGLSLARIGNHEESLVLLRHAEPSIEVTEARIECHFALGQEAELEHVLSSEDFSRLAPERQREILSIVRPESDLGARPVEGPAPESVT